MKDSCIIHEGGLAPGEPGWQVCLSDGAVFTAHPPSGAAADGRWRVGLRVDPDSESEIVWANARTLVAAVSQACTIAGYEGRTGHVLATMTVHLT